MTFQRARSDEQREVRRRTILSTAAGMVAEMPVADLSLNELSRRVGLAKSNVLRYFESREAVLLELLDQAWRDWLDRLSGALTGGAGDTRERCERIAATISASLAGDRLFGELVSVSSAVLERNVSPDVARRYKVAALANTDALATLINRRLPELSAEGATYFAAGTLVSTTGIWPLAHPSEAMLCVYEDPEMAVLRLDFPTALNEMLATLLVGCLVRWPAQPLPGRS
jgi:AcrR family transcriptional regulator